MVHALGVSQNDFSPSDPGRLCRGRERWIEPFELEDDTELFNRLVISGAAFSDDSAGDALRGLVHSQLEPVEIIDLLFPAARFLAFVEDGHPADIPDDAGGVELYAGHRAGGLSEEMLVRWYKVVQGPDALRELLGDISEEKIRGLAVLDDDTDVEELWERLFLFLGMSTLDSPPARYQPAALPELLELATAILVFHRDKHGPALGVYTEDPLPDDGRLGTLCDARGTLLVPFAIPPMLARWDRALHELREEWMARREDEFPVPPAGERSGWEPRWKRRQRRKSDADTRKLLLVDGEDDDLSGEE